MKDYYAILHVLPTAEIDVIKAAYRALSRKYHPDTCQGDKTDANQKMKDINEAYEVLSDPDKRRKHDAERVKANQEDDFSSNGIDDDVRLEEDWLVACKYCPEARASFAHLNKLSRSLAFAFKSYLLDTKQFSDCLKIRDKFRAEFLNTYFGSNPAIQEIGEKLVLAGELNAAKSVNRAVRVMGGDLQSESLTATIQQDYPHLDLGLILGRKNAHARKLFLLVKNGKDTWATHVALLETLNIPFKTSLLGGTFTITYQDKVSVVISGGRMSKWIIDNLSNNPAI